MTKLHVSTHHWLSQARVYVANEEVSYRCRGVDLEARVLYMSGQREVPPIGDDPDVEIQVQPGVPLRLTLDGYDLVTADVTEELESLRQFAADIRNVMGWGEHMADATVVEGLRAIQIKRRLGWLPYPQKGEGGG